MRERIYLVPVTLKVRASDAANAEDEARALLLRHIGGEGWSKEQAVRSVVAVGRPRLPK